MYLPFVSGFTMYSDVAPLFSARHACRKSPSGPWFVGKIKAILEPSLENIGGTKKSTQPLSSVTVRILKKKKKTSLIQNFNLLKYSNGIVLGKRQNSHFYNQFASHHIESRNSYFAPCLSRQPTDDLHQTTWLPLESVLPIAVHSGEELRELWLNLDQVHPNEQR